MMSIPIADVYVKLNDDGALRIVETYRKYCQAQFLMMKFPNDEAIEPDYMSGKIAALMEIEEILNGKRSLPK